MSWALLLARVAWRNIFSSFLNVIIGLIILVGTFLFVVGGSLLGSMDSAMSRSIVSSVTGHLHLYNAESKDKPSVFDNWQVPDLSPLQDFAAIKDPLLAHPNVKAIVPMGINTALLAYGNTVDQVLEKLRKGVSGKPKASREKIESLKSHVRQIITVIQGDFAKLSKISSKAAVDPRTEDDLKKAGSQAFWAGFDADPLGHLEFLENRISNLVPDADQIFLSYIGTDLDAFQEHFDRVQIIDGQAVPKGQRGILVPKYIYEKMFKIKMAQRMDEIHEGLTVKNKKISNDPELKDLIRQNKAQTREITLQLDPLSTAKFVEIIGAELKSSEKDVAKLLSAFFDTNDDNFETRYKIFYEQLAPMLELYRLRMGDTMTIKAYTKSGFVQAVNLKVFGTFNFKGLEKSALSGALSLMDLISYRDLYGFVTPEKLAETQAMKKASGVKFVSRDKAEDELFGGAEVVSQSTQQGINEAAELGGAKITRPSLESLTFTQEQIEKGPFFEAAVILKDESKLKSTLKELQAISDEKKLGLKFIDWQTAAGNLGQFVFVAKAVLFFATAIIFVVALVIINNAVVMATLQRRREIGTLRAMGAQKSFVLSLVLAETVGLGLAFGALGALLGSGVLLWLGAVGIPAGNDFLYFFFSGPRLYPGLSLGSLLGAFAVVLLVTCISALYPALMATRVSPVRAMASED